MVGVLVQRDQTAGDGVARGLIARHDQQDEGGQIARDGKLGPLLGRADQHGDQIIAHGRFARLPKAERIERHLLDTGIDVLLAGAAFGIVFADHGIGPFKQLVAVRLADPEQLGQGLDGIGGGEAGNEVDGPALGRPLGDHGVDQHIGSGADARLHVAKARRGKAAHDHAPVIDMVRGVHRDHRGLNAGIGNIIFVGDTVATIVTGRGKGLWIGRGADNVLMAGQGPKA